MAADIDPQNADVYHHRGQVRNTRDLLPTLGYFSYAKRKTVSLETLYTACGRKIQTNWELCGINTQSVLEVQVWQKQLISIAIGKPSIV